MSTAADYMMMPIDEIVIPKGRRVLRNLDDLADSIRTVGLLNPITVTDGRVLVAGYHRLETCRLLKWPEVPVHIVRLADLDAELADIDENLRRNELSVLERGEALRRRKAIYEAKYPETRKDVRGGLARAAKAANETVSLADAFSTKTAAGTGVSARCIQQDMQIAGSLAPEIREAIRGTQLADRKQDLLKLARLDAATQRSVVKQIVTGKAPSVQAALFAQAKSKVAAEARKAPEPAVIRHCDANTLLGALDGQTVDLLLTDPPYSTDVEDIATFVEDWVPLALSRLKPTGRAFICTGSYPEELFAYLRVLREQQTFTVADVLVWTYRNTIGPAPKKDYKRNWQAIFHVRGAEAPDLDCPILTEQFAVQDINAPDGRLGNRYHAWQKPDELGERLIRHATKAGDLVVDPFAGTGTFLLAAARLGRRAIGGEISDEHLRIATDRGCVREN